MLTQTSFSNFSTHSSRWHLPHRCLYHSHNKITIELGPKESQPQVGRLQARRNALLALENLLRTCKHINSSNRCQSIRRPRDQQVYIVIGVYQVARKKQLQSLKKRRFQIKDRLQPAKEGCPFTSSNNSSSMISLPRSRPCSSTSISYSSSRCSKIKASSRKKMRKRCSSHNKIYNSSNKCKKIARTIMRTKKRMTVSRRTFTQLYSLSFNSTSNC